jgi:general secretion pathway protein H
MVRKAAKASTLTLVTGKQSDWPALRTHFMIFRTTARRQHGFSLLEIMVVVVIIGILISLATISIGSVADDSVAEHGRRLEALLDLASDEAEMQGRELGLRFYQHKYEFSVRNPAVDEKGVSTWVWTPLEADELLKPRNLGDEITLELELEGEEITLDYEHDSEKTYIPQVLILSSGDVEPEFSLLIRPSFTGEGVRLNVDFTGKVETERDEF